MHGQWSRWVRLGGVAALVLGGLACSDPKAMVVAEPAGEGPSVSEGRPAGAPAVDGREHFLGWFQRDDGLLIPVVRHGGVYYTACRGFETPLQPSDAGLEWAFEPSSMKGTTIGFDPATGAYYLAVFDSQAVNFTDGTYGDGHRERLTRVPDPFGSEPTETDTATKRGSDPLGQAPPRALADFAGWYEPRYFGFPPLQVRGERGTFLAAYGTLDGKSAWEPAGAEYVLTPLADELGFTGFENSEDVRLVYNGELGRYELVMRDPDRGGRGNQPPLRMPLVRHPAGDSTPPRWTASKRVGIPSWH